MNFHMTVHEDFLAGLTGEYLCFVFCVSVDAFERARQRLQTLPKITEEIPEEGRDDLLHKVMMYALEHNKGPKNKK